MIKVSFSLLSTDSINEILTDELALFFSFDGGAPLSSLFSVVHIDGDVLVKVLQPEVLFHVIGRRFTRFSLSVDLTFVRDAASTIVAKALAVFHAKIAENYD